MIVLRRSRMLIVADMKSEKESKQSTRLRRNPQSTGCASSKKRVSKLPERTTTEGVVQTHFYSLRNDYTQLA